MKDGQRSRLHAQLVGRPAESIKAVLDYLDGMAAEWDEGDASSVDDAETLRVLVAFIRAQYVYD